MKVFKFFKSFFLKSFEKKNDGLKETIDRYEDLINDAFSNTLLSELSLYNALVSEGVKFDFSRAIILSKDQTFLDIIDIIDTHHKIKKKRKK